MSAHKFRKCKNGHTMNVKQHHTRMFGLTFTLSCRCGEFRSFYKKGLENLKKEWDEYLDRPKQKTQNSFSKTDSDYRKNECGGSEL